MFAARKFRRRHCNIARWEGPWEKFHQLKETRGSEVGVKDGDVVKGSLMERSFGL